MPSRRSSAKSTAPAPAWWSSGGDEECAHCGQFYVYELARRCADCDAEICFHCILVIEDRRLCPECAPTEKR